MWKKIRRAIKIHWEILYRNIKTDLDKLTAKSNEAQRLRHQEKDKFIRQMCDKLNDPLTAPKNF